MDLTDHIGNIVASDYRTATVFKKYNIDFCCGGGKTIEAACQSKGINKNQLLQDLLEIEKGSNPQQDQFNNWDLNRLVNYIEDMHHTYVRTTIVTLSQYLNKVAKVHGAHNPELKEILALFNTVADELEQHMQKEEMTLFAYIKEMANSEALGTDLAKPHFGTIKNPIKMMEVEHDMVGNNMSEISRLSSGYTPPEYACNTYMVSYKLLEEFENDLHQHIHLENNILFPRAIELETQLLK